MEVQNAYAFLSKMETKLIYDSQGVPGLIIYNNNPDDFKDLVDELRTLDAEPVIKQDK